GVRPSPSGPVACRSGVPRVSQPHRSRSASVLVIRGRMISEVRGSARMRRFEFLLFLHVVSVVVWLGAGTPLALTGGTLVAGAAILALVVLSVVLGALRPAKVAAE